MRLKKKLHKKLLDNDTEMTNNKHINKINLITIKLENDLENNKENQPLENSKLLNNYLKEKNAYLQKLVNTYESQYSLLDLSNNNMKNYNVFQEEFSDISPLLSQYLTAI